MSAEKGNLSSLIQNMEGFSGTLNGNSARFDNIITQLSGFTDSLAAQPITPVMADITNAVGSLQEMLEKINGGENSAGLLLNDDELYKNVTGATSNLEHLIADIRNNPKRYLHFSAFDFGRVVHVNTPVAASEKIT
jgi:phospholipid/cholesterol/gamma-HCH transport system substrate-binding protein